MPRPYTLFTGQWADLPLAVVAQKAAAWGYDGLELATWGDHFEVSKVLEDDGYLRRKRDLLDSLGLECGVVTPALVSQATCDDPIDERHRAILPSHVWGDGDPEGVRERAVEEVKLTARAAAAFGAKTLVVLTGSPIWHTVTLFPPMSQERIEQAYRDFARRWTPILDVCDEVGVRIALEVHPTGLAYDFWTTRRVLEAIGHRAVFGINFDPSHFLWQFLDPIAFLSEFADRIYHVDCKDAVRHLDGRNGVMGSHLPWGNPRRGWDFRSVGRGELPWDAILRMLNTVGYRGPVSVEWEDPTMDREQGAPEALEFLRRTWVEPPSARFDAAFAQPGAASEPTTGAS
jgi:sugar phosphate isomerase/epimerase